MEAEISKLKKELADSQAREEGLRRALELIVEIYPKETGCAELASNALAAHGGGEKDD